MARDPALEKVCADFGFTRNNRRAITYLDLTRSEDQLWAEMDAKRRNGIRYADKHGVVVSIASASDAEEFVPVWVNGYCAKYGRYSDDALARIKGWIKSGLFFVARLGLSGPMIAGANFRKIDGDDYQGTLLYSANSSLDEYNRYKPNESLIWHAAKWARNQGYRELILGSDRSMFKRKFTSRTFPVDEFVRSSFG